MTFAMNGLALWHMQPLKPCVSSSSTIHLHQSIHPINNAVMTSRLITPQLAEQFKQYPLYSQDGKKKDAICQCVFFIGKVRWYVLEGQPEGNDFTLFSLSVLPIQNMVMLPSRKWKVSAWMSDITFPRYRYCRTRASSLAQSETFPTRDCSRFCLTCMTGKKFKPNISRRLLAYGC